MKDLILIQCKDEVGLVYKITKALSKYNLNITAMREFVDESSNQFFVRIEYIGELQDQNLLQIELADNLPEQASIIINPKKKKK